jgi:phospholipid N-methyltransferase
MFGEMILNGKQITEKLNISQGQLYKLIALGMPFHQLSEHSRKYYVLDEVIEWLKASGYTQKKVWIG